MTLTPGGGLVWLLVLLVVVVCLVTALIHLWPARSPILQTLRRLFDWRFHTLVIALVLSVSVIRSVPTLSIEYVVVTVLAVYVLVLIFGVFARNARR